MSRRDRYRVNLETRPLQRVVADEDFVCFANAIVRERDFSDPVPAKNAPLRSLSVTAGVRAESAADALRKATAAFVRSLAATDFRVSEKDLRLDVDLEDDEVDDPAELVTAAQAARRLGLSRERVSQFQREQRFPRPLAHLGRHYVYRWVHVFDWARLNGRPVKVLDENGGGAMKRRRTARGD